jgi:hypothetical protein
MDGGGSIGGGSVHAKFHVGPEHNPISEVELRDKAKTTTLRLVFPNTVDLSKVVKGQVITVETKQLKEDPIRIEWEHAAERETDQPPMPQSSAQAAGR